ncbi:MAG: protease pro-enzyme activation domain-containing protein [Bryobacteraceae bacterium]
MAFERRISLPGSEKEPLPGSQPVGTIQKDEPVRVTVVLRRNTADPVPRGKGVRKYLSQEQFAARHGAKAGDIELVEKFAHTFHLTVVESSPRKRRVVLIGTAESMSKAFGAELGYYKIEATNHIFRGRSGSLSIPAELEGAVIAVLGLDTRPVAKPHICRSKRLVTPAAASPGQVVNPPAGTFTPPQVAALYHFPPGVTGAGQTTAIIELGGGYSTTDLQTYFSSLGVTEPNITAVSVDGGTNSPGSDADAEVMLDIEVAGSIAPGANIAVYFAPNTDQGFIDAITDAVHDTARKPSVISISWGAAEDSWTQQSQAAMNAALQDAATLGVTVIAAAGDNGSTDGMGDGNLHVDFPASSPYILACGGTTLQGSDNAISSEVVWNEIANNEGATGGGVSNAFPLPAYQTSAGIPAQPKTGFVGRGVPDVAGDADPTTGYWILVDGQNAVVGGTSAVAPLWSALIALINQQLGVPAGFVNPALYGLKTSFNDITTGNNDDSALGYFTAQPGWDACTGLGSPNGAAILAGLMAPVSTTMNAPRTRIAGSAPKHVSKTQWLVAAPANEEVTVTLVLRRKESSGVALNTGEQLLSGQALPVSRAEAQQALAANPEDIAAVRSFVEQYGLKIVEENAGARSLRVKGTVEQIEKAFGVQLRMVEAKGQQCLSYAGSILVPKPLAGVITAVLGLDQRPVAQHHKATTTAQ